MFVFRLFVFTYGLHGIVTNKYCKTLLNRWNPTTTIINEEFPFSKINSSKRNLNIYVSSRIALENADTHGFVWMDGYTLNIFIYKIISPNERVLQTVAWFSNYNHTYKVSALKQLHNWHNDNFKDMILLSELKEDDDKKAWNAMIKLI